MKFGQDFYNIGNVIFLTFWKLDLQNLKAHFNLF